MSAIRFYLDEDATSKRLLQALRNRGADVLSASEVGMLAQSDEEQLVWALANQRVIYTFNVRDFYQIHSEWLRSGKSHAGIIFGKQEHSIGDQMRGLLKLASIKSAEEMINNVEFLGRWL
ncbi:MAG: DUF5615 family PIN-like protein [Halothece sp.]